jgi:hypothetical protein
MFVPGLPPDGLPAGRRDAVSLLGIAEIASIRGASPRCSFCCGGRLPRAGLRAKIEAVCALHGARHPAHRWIARPSDRWF